MATLSAEDLAGAAKGGVIAEDVKNKIWDLSKIPLPFTDRIGSGNAGDLLGGAVERRDAPVGVHGEYTVRHRVK